MLWLLAATHKLTSLAAFRATVREYRIVPARAVGGAATTIVGLEMALGLGLLVPMVRSTSLIVSAALLAVYAAAVGINLQRGRRHIDCGCTAPGREQPLSGWLVARNLALAVTALAGLLPMESRVLLWVDAISVGATVAVLAALYAALDRLISNSRELTRLGD